MPQPLFDREYENKINAADYGSANAAWSNFMELPSIVSQESPFWVGFGIINWGSKAISDAFPKPEGPMAAMFLESLWCGAVDLMKFTYFYGGPPPVNEESVQPLGNIAGSGNNPNKSAVRT
jgi:hypothetical protein